MGILISITIAIVAVVVVFKPLFQKHRSGQKLEAESAKSNGRLRLTAWEDLIIQKNEVYTAIKDLEFDYMAGKLTDEDYQELKEKCEAEAILILQQIEEFGLVEDSKPIESYGPTEDLVEDEIRRFKENKAEWKAAAE